MKSLYLVLCLVLTCSLGCVSIESTFEDEKEIPLSQVPAEALEAAQRAVEGITLTEAEVEEEEGLTVYELEGIANGIEYEIEVTADGEVLDVEQEEDESDNNHDDDD